MTLTEVVILAHEKPERSQKLSCRMRGLSADGGLVEWFSRRIQCQTRHLAVSWPLVRLEPCCRVFRTLCGSPVGDLFAFHLHCSWGLTCWVRSGYLWLYPLCKKGLVCSFYSPFSSPPPSHSALSLAGDGWLVLGGRMTCGSGWNKFNDCFVFFGGLRMLQKPLEKFSRWFFKLMVFFGRTRLPLLWQTFPQGKPVVAQSEIFGTFRKLLCTGSYAEEDTFRFVLDVFVGKFTIELSIWLAILYHFTSVPFFWCCITTLEKPRGRLVLWCNHGN